MLGRVQDLSRALHDWCYDDCTMSLCARAYDKRDVSGFWAAWCWAFGERHCRKSWLYHVRASAPKEWR